MQVKTTTRKQEHTQLKDLSIISAKLIYVHTESSLLMYHFLNRFKYVCPSAIYAALTTKLVVENYRNISTELD